MQAEAPGLADDCAAELVRAEAQRVALLDERAQLLRMLHEDAGAPPPLPPRVRRRPMSELLTPPSDGESAASLRERVEELVNELSMLQQMLEVREEENAQLRLQVHRSETHHARDGGDVFGSGCWKSDANPPRWGFVSPSRAAHLQRAENARRAAAGALPRAECSFDASAGAGLLSPQQAGGVAAAAPALAVAPLRAPAPAAVTPPRLEQRPAAWARGDADSSDSSDDEDGSVLGRIAAAERRAQRAERALREATERAAEAEERARAAEQDGRRAVASLEADLRKASANCAAAFALMVQADLREQRR
eukprot:TRINITY_DN32260_c0_g1_i1.p2 TRINITY_DN32260_c0_g1~~TRINITY_DN32260_c0_g1_i1.p2  ORF type:complete len:325 (+),score=118.31 TRINITY_DN32260_c0_g1_i1:55-975(+)